MPQRKSVASALENLSQADKDANDRKVAALATIPDPVYTVGIAFDDVYSDKNFNVRDVDSYDYAGNEMLFHSLEEKGLEKRGDPMSFHFTNGKYKTLVGNRRYWTMKTLREREITRRKDAGEDANPGTLPFATVFGLVYTGLTPGQEIHLMCDHIGRKELNEWELCKEVGEMIHHNGLTDKAASTHFGMDANKIARYRMRYAMPPVLAEFKEEKIGGGKKPFVRVGQKALTALYTAYLTDKQAGCGFRETGVNFRQVWEKVKAGDFDQQVAPAKGPATQKRDVIVNQISGIATYGDGPELVHAKEILEWSAGTDGAKLNTALQGLTDLCQGLRSSLADREATILRQSENITRLEDELSTVKGQLDSAESTVAELTAKLASKADANGRVKAGR